MDCIYSVDLSSYGGFNNRNVLCTLSNKNVLALGVNEYIYVLPLEKPNELIPINEINNQCTHLCWNDDGTHLFSIHKDLFCYVYCLKNGILNNFEVVNSFQLSNCKIAAAKWLNKSPKFYFNWTKKDSLNYLEKYYQKTYNSVKNSGLYANNGFIILEKTGKIHVRLVDLNTIKSNFEKLEFDIQCESFDLADFIYDDYDNIVVACTKYDAYSSVFIYNIKLEITNDCLLNGSSQLVSTFYLQVESPCFKTNLLFCQTDHRNSLVFSLKYEQSNINILQFWNFSSSSSSNPYMSTSDPLFDFDQSIGNGDNKEFSPDNGTWAHVNSLNCHAGLISINVPKFPIKYEDLLNSNNNYKFYIIASYDDGTVGFIDRLNYSQSLSDSVNSLTETNVLNNSNRQKLIIKKQRIEQFMISIDQSLTGTIGVGATNTNSLIVFRQSFLKEININTNGSYFLNFYEYLMFSGNDYWDLLTCMKQKLSDHLIERLEERYLRQPLYSIQRAFFVRYYAMLFSLCRQSTNGQIKSIDVLTKLEMNRCASIIAYSVQLIPTSVNEQNFSNMSNSSLIDSIDEVLKYKHEPKINLIDIVQNIINRKNTKIIVNQQLKHLFQWVVDVSLCLVSVTASNKPQQLSFGVSLLNDTQFINEIRRCLIYIKVLFLTASLQQQQQNGAQHQTTNSTFLYSSIPVLPVRSSSTKDLISDLFNIYTKFFNKPNEKSVICDDLLQDQCVNMQSETLSKSMDELLNQIKQPWLGINLATKPCLKLSIDQQFNEEKFNRKDYPLFDIIRFIYFSRSQFTKQCIRCGNYSEMINTTTTTAAAAATSDDNNISSHKNNCIYILDSSSDKCVCGGLWILAPIS